ncbi:ATPase [Paeniglutamicibacter kerguelensis]|uniref:ATPase n=1 Tax=Paeniglutamicibacter kerguelensis TaxID=254788 RepID=UPI0036178F65
MASATWLIAPLLSWVPGWRSAPAFLGRTLDYRYEVVEIVPKARLATRTNQGPFPMQTTYTWSDARDGTFTTLCNNGEPRGLSVVAGAFMGPMMRPAMRKDLANPTSVLESQRRQT